MPDLDALQRTADREGRRCCVGALIVRDGRAFVHLRGPQREFLPNCWDIPGGHVEPGESLLEALDRELYEETGWHLRGQPTLINVVDWLLDPDDPGSGRREFDFIVAADGDLAQPRLEMPQQVAFRWVGADELALLDENRGKDGGLVRSIVEMALAYDKGNASQARAGTKPV